MESRHRTVFHVGELDELIHHLRFDSVPLKEIERRRRLAKESRRFLAEQEPFSAGIEELISAEQEDEAG